MTTRAREGKVALVAGATRGAGRGIAIELGAAGAPVYVTGRSTRAQRSEVDRPETIDETAELVERARGLRAAAPGQGPGRARGGDDGLPAAGPPPAALVKRLVRARIAQMRKGAR